MTARIVFTNDILRQVTRRAIRWGAVIGLWCGIAAGLPIYLIGAVCGLALGPVIGAVTGALVGWVLYAVTTLFYLPMTETKRGQYRVVGASICVTMAFGAAYIYQAILFHSNGDIMGYLTAFFFIPAVLIALWSSQSMATWYIRSSQLA